MTFTSIHQISRFSALDALTCKQQGDYLAVLRVLKQAGRFSAFEASENAVMARTMTRLLGGAHGDLVNSTGCAYPWTSVQLTEAGERVLAGRFPCLKASAD